MHSCTLGHGLSSVDDVIRSPHTIYYAYIDCNVNTVHLSVAFESHQAGDKIATDIASCGSSATADTNLFFCFGVSM